VKTHKILQLIGGGEIGGAEHHVLTLLQGIDCKRFILLSGCLIDGPFAQLTEELKIPTHRFPMKYALDLSPLPALIKKAKQEQVSLIHTHGSRANLLGRLAGRSLKVPVITTVHSSLRQDYLSPKAALLALTLDRLTLPFTSGLITVSEALANEVALRGGRNIRTIYNGISTLPHFDEADYREDLRKNFRKTWGIPSDALVLGSIARLHPTKGLTYLIQAGKILKNRFPKLHLLLIGDGPLRLDLETQLKEAELPFTLTGFLPDAYQALPALDLFVLPSVSEGMGIVLLEAMQASLPIIATQVGGIPEVIRDRKDGLLVRPMDSEALANTIRELLEKPMLAKSLAESGSKHWLEFSVQEMIRKTQDFYEEILRKKLK
jgi:glycosyltransferase involved in cell wall biosynthesis